MPKNDLRPMSQEVLSDVVTAAVGDRQVKAAVFTTYEFEPEFFEVNVLPCLFGNRTWSHMPNVRRRQVADALRSAGPIVVYYDRHGLKAGEGSSKLDYDRIPVSRAQGVFHAKNIIILVEDDRDKRGTLLLVTTSANLTKSGWWENVEVAHVMEIRPGPISIRKDLLGQKGLIATLCNEAAGRESTKALDAVHEFLLKETYQARKLMKDNLRKPRFYAGQSPVPKFLRDEGNIDPECYNLEIISPFFDACPTPKTLKNLLDVLKPMETRIYLPCGDDGAAQCSEEFFKAVSRMPNVKWASLPETFTAGSQHDNKAKRRFVHAKVYRLFHGRPHRSDVQFVGSVNLTDAAHSAGRERNVETAILWEVVCHGEPDWLLKPLPTKKPLSFCQLAAEGDIDGLACHAVTLRFDWQTTALSYHWETEEHLPRYATVRAQGVDLFVIESVRFDKWTSLPVQAAEAVKTHLKSTSILELVDDMGRTQPVLVQETNMAFKPSMLEQLTPGEILEYWSLLKPRQRDMFLERKLRDLLEAKGTSSPEPQPEAKDSLFDRFAGIFHGFSCLEEHVQIALKGGYEREAEYRLLGRQYDSLPTLVEKVSDEDNLRQDPVTAYITLLCATNMLKSIKDFCRRELRGTRQKDFLTRESVRHEVRRLQSEWQAAVGRAKQAMLVDQVANEEFFDWYEDVFVRQVKAPASTGPGGPSQ